MSQASSLDDLADVLERRIRAQDTVDKLVQSVTKSKNKVKAQENLDEAKDRLQILRDEEELLRSHMSQMSEATVPEKATEVQITKTTGIQLPPAARSTKLKPPRLEKYKRDDCFEEYCNDFQDHVRLGQLQDDNLDLYFLAFLDSFTKSKLKSVHLSPEEKKDTDKFLRVYKSKMTPPHKADTLRLNLSDLKQKAGESIDEFSHRISEISQRAYSGNDESSRLDACYSTFLRGLRNSRLRESLREDREVGDYESAIEEANRLTEIRKREDPEARDFNSQPFEPPSMEVLRLERRSEEDDTSRNRRQSPNRENRDQGSSRGRGRDSYQSRDRVSHQSRDREYKPNGRKVRFERGPVICHKCNQPNHFARNCTLNF